MISYTNPVIPGFHPDPSICRDGEDYFLVNSSFEFFPGIPLFHSQDLIHWEQIGHVLTRKSQAELADKNPSKGIWAPTIRMNHGRFYVSATNMSYGGNFYVYTDDIYGEWSDPIWVKQGGIDPSLFFDDDGQVYFSSTYDLPGTQAIGQSRIDIRTGGLLTETKIIWNGSGGKYPEGPHMYKRDGWYYLIAAEGGTEYGHMVTIARGRSPWGPFKSCPNNPILTHRDTMLDQFQAVGHGDMIDTPDGDWWIVFHGIRTTQYMLHHLGRETMISPMKWNEAGWPVVNSGKIITPQMNAVRLPGNSEKMKSVEGNTVREYLKWNFIKNPDLYFYRFQKDEKTLYLQGTNVTLNDTGSPTFIGKRQEQFNIYVDTEIQYSIKKEDGYAGITVYHTNEHHYDFGLVRHEGKISLMLRKHVGDMETKEIFDLPDQSGRCLLGIESDEIEYRFLAGTDKVHMRCFGSGRTQLLSTECMVMTFTGCYIGLFAEKGAEAEFRNYRLSVL